MPISVVLGDNSPLILDALEHLLETEGGFKIVARCVDGEQSLKAVHKHKPEILMVDLRLPKRDGIAVLRELRKEKCPTHVVILTDELKEDELAEAVRLGVRGLLLKNLAPKLIVQCLRRVHAGELWLEKNSVGNALERLLRTEVVQAGGPMYPANVNSVRVIRSERGGGKTIVVSDLQKIKRGETPDVPLLGGDIVEVSYESGKLLAYGLYRFVADAVRIGVTGSIPLW